MAEKITKESVKKVSTPNKESKDTTKASASTKIEKDKISNPISSPSEVDREALKKEILKEVVGEMGAFEVKFYRTSIADSDRFAEMLNNSPKRLVMWELEEGEKKGAIEGVTINGAKAQIPKGVSVLVPQQAAAMIEGYKKAEVTAGENIANMSCGVSIKADMDDSTKSALGL